MLLDSAAFLSSSNPRGVRIVVSALAASVPVVLFCWRQVVMRRRRGQDTTDQLPLAAPDQCQFILCHGGLLRNEVERMHDLVVAPAIDGVAKLYMTGYEKTVSVTRAEHVMQILTSSNHRAPTPVVQKHFRMFAGYDTLAIAEKGLWRAMRKVFGKIFQVTHLRKMVFDINTATSEFLLALSKRQGETVDLCEVFKLVTVDIIGKVAYGHDFECRHTLQQPSVVKAFTLMLESFHERVFTNKALDPRYYFYWWPIEANRKFLAARSTCRTFISGIVEANRGVPDGQRNGSLMQLMLDELDQDKSSISDSAVVDNMLGLLFAGYDTTSITLANAFYMLATHPAVEARAVGEVQRVLGAERMPTYDELATGLPYCTAIIKEVLRLYPAAPLTTRHLDAPVELKLRPGDGTAEEMVVKLPAGMHVWIPLWYVHRHGGNFEQPLRFDPDRFFDPDREAKIHRYAFVPFSGGGRDCPGRKLAMLEAVAVLAALVRKFKFTPRPGFELKHVVRCLVTEPEHGIPVTVELRGSSGEAAAN